LKKKLVSFHQNGREKMATTTSNNIKSLHEKLRVDSGSFQQLQQGNCSFYSSRSFSVKTDSLFLFLSRIAHDATMKNRTASEHRSTKNVHATSDGKRDGVGRVEIFRGRRERV
jgi:hypothetical protein